VTASSFDEFRFVSGSVSRETFDSLIDFEASFRRWAQRINLAAPSTLPDLWKRHILDSAQLARIEPQASRWLDVGSGGGFPGAIMAVILRERPAASIDLVESNRKKAAFLQTALGQLKAPAHVHAKRIEEVYRVVEQPEIVTARALAPLDKLLTLVEPWLSNGATGLFHKGREYRNEIEESAHGWKYDLVEHASLVEREGVILEVRNLTRRSRGRPENSQLRARHASK
jgi:16S rRNA (guanine527-N7)-methyltransferase